MSQNLDFNINLYTDGEMLFNILKVFIRDYKNSTWPHEIERVEFAKKLLADALRAYEEGIKAKEERIQQGFYIDQDLKIVEEMKARLEYWKNKYYELVGEQL